MQASQPSVHALKPMRRSMVFWMGAVTFSFLFWLWGDSFFHETDITVGRTPPKEPLHLSIGPDRLDIRWNEGTWLSASPPSREFRIERSGQDEAVDSEYWLWTYDHHDWERPFFPPGTKASPGLRPPGTPTAPAQTHTIRIALWMLPASFLLIWSPILILRRRRQEKIVEKDESFWSTS